MSASAEPERIASSPNLPALSRVPEIGRVPPGSPTQQRLQEIWETEPGWRGWLSTVDHKTHRSALHRDGVRFPADGRRRGARHAAPACAAERYAADARTIQPAVHDARRDDDFPVRAAGALGIFELPVATHPRARATWHFRGSMRCHIGCSCSPGLFLYASFPLGQAPNAGWFNYVAALRSRVQHRARTSTSTRSAWCCSAFRRRSARSTSSSRWLRMRAPGMSHRPGAGAGVGHADRVGGNLLAVPSVSLAFFMLWLDRQRRHAFLRRR